MATLNFQNKPIFQRRKNEAGFALMSWLLLASVFFSAVMLLSHFAISLKDDLLKKKICAKSSWQYQEKQKRNLEALLRLNPEALVLRARHKKAQQKLLKAIASGQPAAIAVAKAQLLAIQLQKVKLAGKQKKILLQAEIEAGLFTNFIRHKIHNSKVINFSLGIAVEPEQLTEIAPPYRPQSNFSLKQISGAEWQEKIPGGCFVTIERRNLKWFVVLSEGKSSLNFSLL